MLASITPLGERGREQRWERTATALAVGSVAGGAAYGAAAGLVGALLALLVPVPSDGAAGWGAAALVAAGAALLDLRPGHRRLPTVHRQVDEAWLGRYRGWVTGLGFGVQLGVGVATIVVTAGVYAVAVLAVLSGDVLAGAALGAAFGLARALPVLTARRSTTPDRLRRALRRHAGLEAAARRLGLAAQGAVALVALVAAAGATP